MLKRTFSNFGILVLAVLITGAAFVFAKVHGGGNATAIDYEKRTQSQIAYLQDIADECQRKSIKAVACGQQLRKICERENSDQYCDEVLAKVRVYKTGEALSNRINQGRRGTPNPDVQAPNE